MSRTRKTKPFTRMNAEELARATAEFDEEFVADTFVAAPPKARARLKRAWNRPGRPRQGRGAQVISVSVEKGLLDRADDLAKTMGITRSNLIARGIKAVLAAEGRA